MGLMVGISSAGTLGFYLCFFLTSLGMLADSVLIPGQGLPFIGDAACDYLYSPPLHICVETL